jgi:hypothetical protein
MNVLLVGGPLDGETRDMKDFVARQFIVPVREYVLRGVSYPSFGEIVYKLESLEPCHKWIAVAEGLTLEQVLQRLVSNYHPSKPESEKEYSDRISWDLTLMSALIEGQMMELGMTTEQKANAEMELRKIARRDGIKMEAPMYCKKGDRKMSTASEEWLIRIMRQEEASRLCAEVRKALDRVFKRHGLEEWTDTLMQDVGPKVHELLNAMYDKRKEESTHDQG